MAHFIPSREADAISWLKNFSGKMKPVFVILGMPEELADAILALMNAYLADYDNAGLQLANSRKATATKNASAKAVFDAVQNLVAIMKKNPKWSAAISKELRTDALPDVIDPVNYKPQVKAVLDGGGVRLRIKKFGVKAINVYGKLPGEDKFILLATITRGVWVDKRPLGTPGIAEIRQYMVKGVIADQEIGHFSDIVTISFGG